MLRRCLLIAKSQAGGTAGSANEGKEKLAPRLTLDGFGVLSSATASAQPVDPRFAEAATRDHPPGFYGPTEASLAVNALTPAPKFSAIEYGGARLASLSDARAIDFRPFLMVLAALLVIADAIAMAMLCGALAANATEAEATLEVVSAVNERAILSLSGGGRVRDFNLIYRVVYRLVDKQGIEIVPNTEIAITGVLPFLDAEILAKEAEGKLLQRDMQADAIQQILWRLSAIKIPS